MDYLHGSSSSSLEGVRIHGLVPAGKLFEEGMVPFCGELGLGISSYGVNLNGISVVEFEGIRLAIQYALDLQKWSPEISGKNVEEWSVCLQSGGARWPNVMSRWIEIEGCRQKRWPKLSPIAKKWIGDPFPVVYRIIGTESMQVNGEVGLRPSQERVIQGTVPSERLIPYVPTCHLEELVREKTGFAGVRTFRDLYDEVKHEHQKVEINRLLNWNMS